MPTFEEHQKFILSNPYAAWYIIWNYSGPIGSIYLSKGNEVGLFLSKPWQGIGIGKVALGLLRMANPRKRYLANIAPGNEMSQKFFEGQGFQLIQNTYELAGAVV
jgi:RimJ/RimL family protein N-acetyltransferase